MLWVDFSFGTYTNLMSFDGDLLSARGGVSGRTIRQLYTDYLLGLIGFDDIFIHDNAPVYIARVVEEILYKLYI